MSGLLGLGCLHVEQWVRVFYATVWIHLDHEWFRFKFEGWDMTLQASQIREFFGLPESTTRIHIMCYGLVDPPRCPHDGVAPLIAHILALFHLPFSDGLRRSPHDFTTVARVLQALMRHTLLPMTGYKETLTHLV